MKETMWWGEIGCNAYALETTPSTCFEMDDAIALEPTTPTTKRGGTRQPQAVGQRKKRIIGEQELMPGASASSCGPWLPAVPLPTSATVGPVAHTGKSRRMGEASATVREPLTQDRVPTPTQGRRVKEKTSPEKLSSLQSPTSLFGTGFQLAIQQTGGRHDLKQRQCQNNLIPEVVTRRRVSSSPDRLQEVF
jgi:hypothetical protein